MAKLRNAITSPIVPWVLLGCAAVAVGAHWLMARDDVGVKRWSHRVDDVTEPVFSNLLTPKCEKTSLVSGPIDWGRPHVSVYSVPTLATSQGQPTLKDLGDSGQAHAIDFLATHAWTELQAALSDAGRPADKDPFQFKRVLVSTVTPGADWNPGDRMMWTRVFVQPINFRFTGYTIAATDNETLKVASTETTRTQKISADLALTFPGLKETKADLSPSTERASKTTSDITTQYEQLGIDVTPEFLRIIRESEAGGNVLGNATISLSVETDPELIQKSSPCDTSKRTPSDSLILVTESMHVSDGDKELDEDVASITPLPQQPLPHCPLKARIWMLYEQRNVVGGAEYYAESQQEVKLIRSADLPVDVVIVPADDVSPAVWRIRILGNGVGEKPDEAGAAVKLLQIRLGEEGQWRDIAFTDFRQASELAHWLRTQYKKKIGSHTFNYAPGSSVVPYKITEEKCNTSGH